MARTYFRPRGPNPWISHQGVEYQAGDDGWVTVDDDALAAIFRDGGYVEKGAMLSAADAAAVRALVAVPAERPSLSSVVQTFTSKAALFVGTPLVATATMTAYRARVASTDLAPVSNWNTNAAGYAVGAKAITTAAGGVGALYRGDTIGVAGSGETYTSISADSDLSDVGTVTLAGSGLAAAIPAATTLLSVLARGERIFGAINCDNAVEAAIACANPNQRDFELRLGEAIIITSTAPISNIWFTTSGGIAINAHRLDVQFGA